MHAVRADVVEVVMHVVRIMRQKALTDSGHARLAQKTVFAQKMGSAMEDVEIPLLGADFNTWFPLLIVIYCSLL